MGIGTHKCVPYDKQKNYFCAGEMMMEIYNSSVKYEQKLPDGTLMTSQYTNEEFEFICENLIRHNVENTFGLLKKPGVDIVLFLKIDDKVIGAISCDTFNMSLYIDVMWLDKAYRGRGYGKALLEQAEIIAKEKGCIFSHTSTFSYQSPEFYKACGYEIFAELNDYPNDIVQYFYKKKL